MSRPKNKLELTSLSRENYEKLLNLINSYSEAEQNADFPPGTLNRNIRDVIAHLHHWHMMLLRWYDEGMKGLKPDMPAKGYSWKMTPELNRDIQKMYAIKTLSQVLTLFGDSYMKVRDIIVTHSDEELFTKKLYKWTGSTSLGVYLVSNTSSHYDWAIKLIKRSKK
ncbi:MAG: ClbS/DfsB family four-helix bundle protein [Bacteroidia bacterium]|nr:ClbS/DfsB family four-helix bundle protein [Bacteroidia bacterium]NNF30898.1 ClbS/DfsB family four-helix bundle protein [Flavobacteriaceae bacterium]MBT8275396.1 ClbS/DfsB family four-helix bundle protein [Bacteroidia bacterium]NNJ80700.1 ClbS/DfsB family four-helix bundle protein [Flavobacteriaceae bacterium]NNK54511.1 ClbS/DfsB family four-helix bundle protein [Flavobacteriaceae bacterium]